MTTISEEQKWQELRPDMYEELARIKADQEMIVEARNRFMNGKATKEQIFLALNAATTNMVIYRELYEKNIRIVVELYEIKGGLEKLKKSTKQLIERRKTRKPEASVVPPPKNIISFPLQGRKEVRI
ncbi:MAG: hypothetical protein Q8R88_10520 [Desulfoprunum sp.]|nr:hypothetical protein [Desulfoprunum sp.]